MKEMLPLKYWNKDWKACNRLKKERTGLLISGSDVPTIMGENPYKTPLMLYYEKKGMWQPEQTEPIFIGKEIEEFIIHMFEEKQKMKFYTLPALEKDPFVVHVDGVALTENGELAVVEIKNLNVFNRHWKHYYWQLLAYMHVLGIERGFLSIMFFGKKFFIQEYKYDENDAKLMMEKVNEFVERLKNNNPPELAGTSKEYEILLDILDEVDGVAKDNDLDKIVSHINEVQEQIKELKQQEDFLKGKILKKMEEKGVKMLIGETAIAELKTIKRKNVDKSSVLNKKGEYKQLRIKVKNELAGMKNLFFEDKS